MDVRPSSRGICTRIDRWSLLPVVDGLLLPPKPFAAWWFLVGGFCPVGFRTQMRAREAANCETLQQCFICRSTFSNSSSVTPFSTRWSCQSKSTCPSRHSELTIQTPPVRAANPNAANLSRQSKRRQSEPPVNLAAITTIMNEPKPEYDDHICDFGEGGYFLPLPDPNRQRGKYDLQLFLTLCSSRCQQSRCSCFQ
jgi:hypothetical protein